MRYIDADNLQETFKELHGGKRSLLIDTEPTADARENVRGEWISKMVECSRENYDQVFCCSVCGVSNDWRRTNFCPHCGADMRAKP